MASDNNETTKPRVRKKPDLRLHIPSYPHEYVEYPNDYVEMPEDVKRLIQATTGTPSNLKFIDDDTSIKVTSSVKSSTANPTNLNPADDELRAVTPEVVITGPNVTLNDAQKNKENADRTPPPEYESPIAYRRDQKRNSLSHSDGLQMKEFEPLQRIHGNNIPTTSTYHDGQNTGKRRVGRRKKSWLRNIREWTRIANVEELLQMARDRSAFSKLTADLQ